MRSDTGDDFVILNALDLRDQPLQVAGVEPGETSEDVLARYSEPFLGKALLSAAHPVMFGAAAQERYASSVITGAWSEAVSPSFFLRKSRSIRVSTSRP